VDVLPKLYTETGKKDLSEGVHNIFIYIFVTLLPRHKQRCCSRSSRSLGCAAVGQTVKMFVQESHACETERSLLVSQA
jgi:hypothetical protein